VTTLARLVAALLTLLPVSAPAIADAPAAGRPQDRPWIEAFARGDAPAAEAALAALLEAEPTNAILHYNLAAARAMRGELDPAAESLLDALTLGFVDLHRMERDPRLAPLRDHPAYRRVVANWRTLLDRRADAELAALLSVLGDGYRVERDAGRRIAFVAALGEADLDAARAQIDVMLACVAPLFDVAAPDADRPDPWIIVLVPTPADYLSMARRTTLAGFYDHDRRRLVTRDIGPTLRHELFHALHHRHMDRLAQRHPVWIQEGLATLYEDLGDGGLNDHACRPVHSWRTDTARSLARAGALTPWPRLFAMDPASFLARRAQANYAQARAVMLYLHERGDLAAWYHRYTDRQGDDPTGGEALAHVLGEPLEPAQRRFRRWARALEPIDRSPEDAAVALGVPLGPGVGLGPVVDLGDDPVERFHAARDAAPFRHGDTILALDGVATRTLHDLARALEGRSPGDALTVTVRRKGEPRDLRIRLP
jgi:hypothetical protein